MTDAQQQLQTELLTRLDLMETMVREGRKTHEYWGWGFLLWGAAYLIAIGWSHSAHIPNAAWPVTMIAAAVLTAAVGAAGKHAHRQTTLSRSVCAIWTAVGAALFLYGFSIAISGYSELHSFYATVEILLGVANFASALILRWSVQFAVALIWGSAAVASCFAASTAILPLFVAASLLGNVGFGLYLTYCERRDRSRDRTQVQHG